MNIFSGGSYIEKLLRDGGDLDSMDRSLFDCDVSENMLKKGWTLKVEKDPFPHSLIEFMTLWLTHSMTDDAFRVSCHQNQISMI